MSFKTLILSCACLLGAFSAASEPAASPPLEAFDAALAESEAAMKRLTDDMFRQTGPARYAPQQADMLLGIDPRFAVAIERGALMRMARPGERQRYTDQVAWGWFAGSFAEFARKAAVESLMEPVYGRFAAVLPEHNPPAFESYVTAFAAADEARAEAGGAAPATCQPGEIPSDAALEQMAGELERYAAHATDFAVAFPETAEPLLTRVGVWGQNVSASREIVYSWAMHDLMQGLADDPYAPQCPLQGTALDALIQSKNVQQVGPFSWPAAPLEVTGDVVSPETDRGD